MFLKFFILLSHRFKQPFVLGAGTGSEFISILRIPILRIRQRDPKGNF